MFKYVLLCFLALFGYYAWTVYPINHGPGIIAPHKPNIDYLSWEKPFTYKGENIIPVKKYSGELRILAKKQYFFDDRSELSPIDILVGWDDMSDERNVSFINFSLSDRYFKMSFTRPPIPLEHMYSEMDLLHLIPSSEEVKKTMNGLRKGHIVSIEGFIVNVESSSSFNWESEHLRRDHTRLPNLVLWVNKIHTN